jgi:leucyl aminopeptidase
MKAMQVKLKKSSLEEAISSSSFDALLIGAFQNEGKKKSPNNDLEKIDQLLEGFILENIKEEDFKFENASCLLISTKGLKIPNKLLPSKIILLGLGKKEDSDKKTLRKAIAAGFRKAKSLKIKKLALSKFCEIKLIAETILLLDYEFKKYKTKKDEENSKKLEEVEILLENKPNPSEKNELRLAEILAEACYKSRDLVWEPACLVNPSYLAEEAKKIQGSTLKVSVLEKPQCEKLKMGAFLAVAQGSDQTPKFIEITYTPKGKFKKHIAIVGKGVTFDSGGLSLKPAKAMEMMKEDMSGSASVLGIMLAISKLKPKNIKITGIIAATENMPSGKAYRPGDVITAMNGKTIEVNNTDAEGRLTLADAVYYVSQKNPDEIIDIATLTGACIVALGNICAGLMTNDEEFLKRVKAVADEEGENMWQLPLYEEYKENLKSPIADLINAGSKGQAGAQNGALFIKEFLGKDSKSKKEIPWLHIDIAGPCWLDTENDWSNKGASGIPTRTLINYILVEDRN